MRAFATFEYKTCEEKCCFFKTYYDWNVKTSKQKEIMCTLDPESESWDEYVISLQNAIDRNFKKWMEDIGE